MCKIKRKKRKFKTILILTLIVLVFISSGNFLNSKLKEVSDIQQSQASVNDERLKERIYETKVQNAKRVIKELKEKQK